MIKEKIDSDYIEAYKAHEETKVSVLRLIKSAIKNDEIKKKAEMTEDEVVATLRREAKQRKESIEEYQKGGKTEMADKEKAELEIIEAYLPKQLGEDEVRKIVEETIAEQGISDPSGMGKLIGAVMGKYGSSVDGGTVSRIARELLSK